MLYALESKLVAALPEALPEGVQVRAGPSAGPPEEGVQRVEVSASRLEVPDLKEDAPPGREPAHLTHLQHWSADGEARDFTLPAEVPGEILEVESPPGRLMRLGQDYQLDGTTVRFFSPPAAAADAVVATVRQGRARGFLERRPCQARLTVTSWATDFPRADELLDRALAAVLTRCVELETLEATHLGASGVRLRLLEPAVTLVGLERAWHPVGTRLVPSAVATLRLEARLELSVAVGSLPPEGRIQELRYTLLRAR